MQIHENSYLRAASLVRRIVAPSNKISMHRSASDDFSSAKTHPVYTASMSTAPDADINDTHNILNDLYHTKEYLDRYKPSDYRIGAVNELQADINELSRMVIFNNIALKDLPKLNSVNEEEIDKALTIAINHSGISELEFYYLYLYAHRYKFPNEGWGRLAGSEGLAYGEPTVAETILDEVLKVQERSYSYSGAFNQWTHSFKSSLGQDWLFERFIKTINSSNVTGKVSPPKMPFLYKKYSPSLPEFKDRGITINDFPGPGMVIHGIHSPVFHSVYLSNRFGIKNIPVDIHEMVDLNYRNKLIDGAGRMSKTTYGFFRGVVIISNPEIMKVDNTPYSLVIFNDHFPSESHNKIAYLIDSKVVASFLHNPYENLGAENILNPEYLNVRGDLRGKVIKLFSLAATAGFCEEAPGYNKDNWDVKQRKYIHDQIEQASVAGFTQLDLLREAYRLYSLGYYYNRAKNNFYRDEYVLLKELLRINKKMTQGEGEIPPMPVVFPFTFMDHAVDEQMVKDVGFVGANMIVYKNSINGDGMLFPSSLKNIDPGEIDNLSVDEMRELIGGTQEQNLWSDFRESCEYSAANPLVVDPVYKNIGKNIIKQSV